MVGLTLEEVLELESFKGSKIIVGEDHLDRIVTNVTGGEVPDIANWLTGGELVLSTFFAVSRDPGAASCFARKIISSPAAALAIKPARFLGFLPPDVLEHAREFEFPIIEVPSGTRWTAIVAQVYAAIARLDMAGGVGETGDELLKLAIDGRGLKSIVQEASRKLRSPVVIIDLVTGANIEAEAGREIPKELVALAKPESGPREAGEEAGRIHGLPIDSFHVGGRRAYPVDVTIGSEVVTVVAAFPDRKLDEAALSLLKKAAEASGVELARQRAVENVQARMCGDFLEELDAGRISPHQIDSRVTRLGGNLTEGYAIMNCSFEPEEKLARFCREVSRVIRGQNKYSLVMEHNKVLIVILAPAPELSEEKWAWHARQAASTIAVTAQELGGRASIGISRWRTGSHEITRSLDEAKIALESGRRLSGDGSITDFDQIGVYRLLLPLAREASEEGRRYYQETVGKLAEYDGKFGTELIETLEAFRRNNENIALTAKELHAHRHTVRYRLQRIAQITGCEPLVAADRDKLYMGLYVKNILGL